MAKINCNIIESAAIWNMILTAYWPLKTILIIAQLCYSSIEQFCFFFFLNVCYSNRYTHKQVYRWLVSGEVKNDILWQCIFNSMKFIRFRQPLLIIHIGIIMLNIAKWLPPFWRKNDQIFIKMNTAAIGVN